MYKIFEPGLTRASSNDAKACVEEGWPTYWKTETHGIPHILTVQVDFYNKNGTAIDEQINDPFNEINEGIDKAKDFVKEKG